MTKKFMFILLMSGVILSPMGVYAMDDEGGAPGTSISRAAPSAQADIEKVAPPFPSLGSMKLSDGERLQKIGDDWVNKAGTIRIPAPKGGGQTPIVFEDGEQKTLTAYNSRGFFGSMRPYSSKGDITNQFPGNPFWAGTHHLFIVNSLGRPPTIEAFPYIDESRVPSAAPAPTLQ
ncbi:MAG: hypothetical protein JNJ47_01390 [Alphaproteobacteria bacterium]|nr:hypothetical protein [Alphaproteobacteria bacterium]